MEEFIQVFTTLEKKEEAERITQILVEKRLAACAQIIGPVKSTYWWKGNIEKTEEWLCIIKSKKTLYEKLESTIKKLHSYQIPEITAISFVSGNKDYLEWLSNELKLT